MDSQQLRLRLCSSGLADAATIEGCSPNELSQITNFAKCPLPNSYLDFMSTFGRRAGRFLREVECFFPGVLSLRTYAVELLSDLDADDGPLLQLPEEAFVFAMRNREQFMFFDFSGAEVRMMHYIFPEHKFDVSAGLFWNFLEVELEQAERAYRIIRGTPYDLLS